MAAGLLCPTQHRYLIGSVREMEYQLEIQQGDTFAEQLDLRGADGLPIDLTGATARMQLRPYPSSPTVVIELSTVNGRLSIQPAGVIIMMLTASDTALLQPGAGVYDMKLTYANGIVDTIIEGRYVIDPQVTR